MSSLVELTTKCPTGNMTAILSLMEHPFVPEVTTSSRKDDHIRINLEEDVQFRGLTTGLEQLRFEHHALPEMNFADVDLSLELFGRSLHAPLLISSMTGGTERAAKINLALAEAAQATGIAMGLGSMRAAIEKPETAHTFQVRSVAPHILLFANLGAVQFNYGYGVDQCRAAVEIAGADALILHFNAIQEAVQPEGDTNFSGLLHAVEAVCTALRVDGIPVIAKEVGWGFSEQTCRQLASAGVAAIDVAGAGGTSWSQVEMHRAPNASHARVAAAFVDWGIPTAPAIRNARAGAPSIPTFASGGLRNGVDAAKCFALGASLAGMASPYLKAAVISTEAVCDAIHEISQQIRISMFCSGATTTCSHSKLSS